MTLDEILLKYESKVTSLESVFTYGYKVRIPSKQNIKNAKAILAELEELTEEYLEAKKQNK